MEWSETTYSPEWTDEDIADALDWQTEQNLLCECGHPVDETHDDDLRAAWTAERRICWACAALERAQRRDTSDGKQKPPGTKYGTRNRAKEMNGRH